MFGYSDSVIANSEKSSSSSSADWLMWRNFLLCTLVYSVRRHICTLKILAYILYVMGQQPRLLGGLRAFTYMCGMHRERAEPILQNHTTTLVTSIRNRVLRSEAKIYLSSSCSSLLSGSCLGLFRDLRTADSDVIVDFNDSEDNHPTLKGFYFFLCYLMVWEIPF